ncbi:MAG: hypothetical protein CMM74_12640 [Rhodospirillaceae bacterium]|nr:hypothetical protein [Rhodospirillaceae bacterium]
MKLVTFGETMAQYNAKYMGPYNPTGKYLLDVAGAESNVAVNLIKLGVAGIETMWVSRLGDDEAGRIVLSRLDGITRVDACICPGERTGVCYLNHYGDGNNIKTYKRAGSAASKLTFDDVAPHLGSASVLHVTGITPALSRSCKDAILCSLKRCQKLGVHVSFDANYREQLWSPSEARSTFDEMIEHVTLFKVGRDEAEVLWGLGLTAADYAKHFHGLEDQIVIVTDGALGATLFDGNITMSVSGLGLKAVDPVGAGDAFVAGFLGGLSERSNFIDLFQLETNERKHLLWHALRVANVCGALVTTRRGDTQAMPDMDEVTEFMATDK